MGDLKAAQLRTSSTIPRALLTPGHSDSFSADNSNSPACCFALASPEQVPPTHVARSPRPRACRRQSQATAAAAASFGSISMAQGTPVQAPVMHQGLCGAGAALATAQQWWHRVHHPHSAHTHARAQAPGSVLPGLPRATQTSSEQPHSPSMQQSTALQETQPQAPSQPAATPQTVQATATATASPSDARSRPNAPQLLLAGAMSAVVSRTCVAPLERVKMELVLKQGSGGALATAAQVARTEGVRGFWKGNGLNLLRTAPFKAVNFMSFDTLHLALVRATGSDGNVERFLAGALAGVTATLVCFPLDVVRTRLLSRVRGPHYGQGPFSTLAGMLRHEGFSALYTGCLPAVIGMAPAGAVYYGVFDYLKHRHMAALAAAAHQQQQGEGSEQSPQQRLSAGYTLLYGALAGAASEIIVYPLEVVRRRMQMQSMALAAAGKGGPPTGGLHAHLKPLPAAAAAHGAHAHAAQSVGAAKGLHSSGWARVVGTCAAILRADGAKGFYTGLGPNMLQVLPSVALSYYVYDTVKAALSSGGA